MKLLIVDDCLDAADSLAALLTDQGHEVQTAYSGIDALRIAAQFSPRFVLLDISMPGMDGRQVARRLRDKRTYGDVALIALTALGDPEDIWTNKDAGFDFHVTKPALLSDLNLIMRGLM